MNPRFRIVGSALAAVMLLSVAAAPAALGKGRPLKAVLTGAAEVPSPGDPDGTGLAKLRLNQGKRRVCYKIQVNDIDVATAVHIHAGAADVSGGVVLTLGTPDVTGFVKGCVNDVERSLIKDMRKHRSDYYVNVHNAEFADGALRGQLSKKAPGRHRK